MTALSCGIVTVLALNVRRIPDLRATMDAGVNASALPAVSVASLVGFGAVVAAMPAFEVVRDAVLGIGGGPLVSLAVATNTLAALTGSASGGLTIALDALGATYLNARPRSAWTPRFFTASRSSGRERSTACRTTARWSRCLPSAVRRTGKATATFSWSPSSARSRARRRHRARIGPGLF